MFIKVALIRAWAADLQLFLARFLHSTSMKVSQFHHSRHKKRQEKGRRGCPLSLLLLALLCAVILSCALFATPINFTFTAQLVEEVPAGDMRKLGKFGIIDTQPTPPEASTVPVLAYAISGSTGDAKRMLRLLKALYHPRNEYLLHLDNKCPPDEFKTLKRGISMERIYVKVKNVNIVDKPNLVSDKGITVVASRLHYMAILLQDRKDWDWFIQLSAADYPLHSQDDMLHALSSVPKGLNFLQYDGHVGENTVRRATNIVLDTAIHSANDSTVVTTDETRDLPTAFKIFSGSAYMTLSRAFCDFCTRGYDNLPRSLLLYYALYDTADEGYFQTTICNAPDFQETAVNLLLHLVKWDNPPKQHPRNMEMKDWEDLTKKGYLFARKFSADSPVLDRIDAEILHRTPGFFTPGAWCAGDTTNEEFDPCNKMTQSTLVKPGMGSQLILKRLTENINNKEEQQLYHECATVQ